MFVKAHAASNCKEGLQKTNNFKQQEFLHWPKYPPTTLPPSILKVLHIFIQKIDLTDNGLFKIIITIMYVSEMDYSNDIRGKREKIGLFCYYKLFTLPVKQNNVI